MLTSSAHALVFPLLAYSRSYYVQVINRKDGSMPNISICKNRRL